MQCAISGNPPTQPVVSPKSGAIFERSLVEAYIQEHGKDPITSEPLSTDELITLRASLYQQPRNVALNSVPSLLSSLQNEWDAIALELFQLRKQLDDTRKELSTALYHHDAAVRVAARAIKERDEARKALQDLTLSISGGEPVAVAAQETEEAVEQDVQMGASTVPEDISTMIIQANEELLALHKSQKQKPNVSVATPLSNVEEDSIASKPFKKISCTSTTALDKKIYVTSSTGITSVFDPASKTYNKDDSIAKNNKISCITKTSTATCMGLTNGQVMVNNSPLKVHQSSVVSLCPHPSLSQLLVSLDQQGTLALLNIESMEVVFSMSLPCEIVAGDIHPDGALVAAAGVDGNTYIVDLRSGEVTGTYSAEVAGSTMTSVKFGTNGYWLFAGYAVPGDEGEKYVLVWDMRKDKSSKIPLNYTADKILLDKSSQICLCLSAGNIEIAQFTKQTKSWVKKAALDLDVDEDVVNGVVVDDLKPEVLEVAVVTASSAVKLVTIS